MRRLHRRMDVFQPWVYRSIAAIMAIFIASFVVGFYAC